ncbi:MAG: YitT family protein [Anaerotignaceae bacterium]
MIKHSKTYLEYIFVVIGTLFISAGITVFFSPNNMVIGGFSSLGIILKSLTADLFEGGIPISLTNLVLNIPLFIVAIIILGKKYISKTFFATLFFSLALEITSLIPPFLGDLTLICIYGGILDGIGMGFILRASSSTGGVDLLATLIQKKIPYYSIASIMFIINAIIICIGFFAFGIEKAMYSIIAIFISTKVVNLILEGLSFSKAALIISDKSEEIAKSIMSKQDRGVTALSGRGMYTGESKDVLLCIFGQKELIAIKTIVKEIDPKAFIVLTDIKEVMGEGFKSIETP